MQIQRDISRILLEVSSTCSAKKRISNAKAKKEAQNWKREKKQCFICICVNRMIERCCHLVNPISVNFSLFDYTRGIQ